VVQPTQGKKSQGEDQGEIDNQEFGVKIGDSRKLDGMGCSSEADVSGSEIENRGVCQNQNVEWDLSKVTQDTTEFLGLFSVTILKSISSFESTPSFRTPAPTPASNRPLIIFSESTHVVRFRTFPRPRC